MFGKVKLFKTYSKKDSKKVDVCYRDYPDEENFASETIIELDYEDTLIIIKRHLAKDEEEKEIYAYGIFEFDKKTKKKRYLSDWLKEDEEFKPEDLRTVIEESKKSKRNCKY